MCLTGVVFQLRHSLWVKSLFGISDSVSLPLRSLHSLSLETLKYFSFNDRESYTSKGHKQKILGGYSPEDLFLFLNSFLYIQVPFFLALID